MEQFNEPRDCSTHVQSSLKESFIGASQHWVSAIRPHLRKSGAFIVRRISQRPNVAFIASNVNFNGALDANGNYV